MTGVHIGVGSSCPGSSLAAVASVGPYAATIWFYPGSWLWWNLETCEAIGKQSPTHSRSCEQEAPGGSVRLGIPDSERQQVVTSKKVF